mmetsp:Transcript_7570/g.12541  ORF Transcript_7570/g.12541 Transcript_7570/m.12541 type:complete len:134 (-) Transcript_7570:213-614(-)
MTSKLVSLVKNWPRVTGRATVPSRTWAAVDDIWHLFVGHEEETEDGEALETVCGTAVDDNSIAKDPSHRRDAFDKARRVRTESMRRHYHDLIYPAPCSPFDAASRPLSEAVLVHIQEERSRSIDRSSLMGLEW